MQTRNVPYLRGFQQKKAVNRLIFAGLYFYLTFVMFVGVLNSAFMQEKKAFNF